MWLFVPSPSAQEQEPSTLAGQCLPKDSLVNLERSCTLNGKPSTPRSWSAAWQKNDWMKLLSGLTSTQSENQSAVITWSESVLMPSLEESPANPTQLPDSNSNPMTREICLTQHSAQLRHIRLDSSRWKTSQGSLFQMDLGDSQRAWSDWATTWRQSCSKLVMLGQVTDGQECLSWRIAELALGWRTPSAGDVEGGVMDVTLAKENDWCPKIKLRDDAVNWQTPKAWDGTNGSTSPADALRNSPNLPVEAQSWATPRGFDGEERRNMKTMVRIAKHGGDMTLPTQVAVAYSLPQETQVNGLESSEGGLNCARRYRALRLMRTLFKHRLNPLFAEWLMGWPERWSCVGIGSGPSETEWFRYKQQLDSAYAGWLSEVTK